MKRDIVSRTICGGVVLFCFFVSYCFAADSEYQGKLVAVSASDKKVIEPEEIQAKREEAERAKKEQAELDKEKAIEQQRLKAKKALEGAEKIELPADNSVKFMVKEIQFKGNALISVGKIISSMPMIYTSSNKSLDKAPTDSLYDLRGISDVLLNPGQPKEISSRSIQGFTQYVVSLYRESNYAGVYVYVPAEAIKGGTEVVDQVLPVTIIEAMVSDVTIRTYDIDQKETEKPYLRKAYIESWSPVVAGKVVNQKKLDDFINLLNQNPDRYVTASVSKGATPNSLGVAYDVYEANPWHWFVQVDNSGTRDREWNPKIGMINTNLFGIDDTFSAVYQAPWDKTFNDTYSIYGSYDFPIFGPKLRLNLFGGYSQYNAAGSEGVDFLGRGDFYGGTLRYNLFQADSWFFDVTGTISHEKSEITPNIFPEFLASNISMWTWGMGVDIHRKNDMSETSLKFNFEKNMGGGSDQDDYQQARDGAEKYFTIYTFALDHSQYLDPNKIHRGSGTLRWIIPDDRLVPSKMTTFGGMYTVRGYRELEVIGDGGVLASLQYEFDIVKYEEAKDKQAGMAATPDKKKPFLTKLAPLAFIDYGNAMIKDPRDTENKHTELLSVGVGVIVGLTDHFTSAVYYGYPLKHTDSTEVGDGRVNASFLFRW